MRNIQFSIHMLGGWEVADSVFTNTTTLQTLHTPVTVCTNE